MLHLQWRGTLIDDQRWVLLTGASKRVLGDGHITVQNCRRSQNLASHTAEGSDFRAIVAQIELPGCQPEGVEYSLMSIQLHGSRTNQCWCCVK